MKKPKTEVGVYYKPHHLEWFLKKNRLSLRLLADILNRRQVRNFKRKPITHQTIKNWRDGNTEPGFYTWLSIEAVLRKEFPPNGRVPKKSLA